MAKVPAPAILEGLFTLKINAVKQARVLVLYASKYGATRGLCEAIARRLEKSDCYSELHPASEMIDPGQWDALVLGSAIYAGRWRSDAVNYLEQFAETLSTKAVWIFASGPTGEEEAEALLEEKIYPEKLRPLIRHIAPQDLRMFHGALTPEQLNFLEKAIIKVVKAPTGDFRDWEAIEQWSDQIAASLKALPELEVRAAVSPAAPGVVQPN